MSVGEKASGTVWIAMCLWILAWMVEAASKRIYRRWVRTFTRRGPRGAVSEAHWEGLLLVIAIYISLARMDFRMDTNMSAPLVGIFLDEDGDTRAGIRDHTGLGTGGFAPMPASVIFLVT